MRDRLISALIAVILVAVAWQILQRMFLVVVVQLPWWVLAIGLIVLALAIEHFVRGALGRRRR
jgi:hypothetical protein